MTRRLALALVAILLLAACGGAATEEPLLSPTTAPPSNNPSSDEETAASTGSGQATEPESSPEEETDAPAAEPAETEPEEPAGGGEADDAEADAGQVDPADPLAGYTVTGIDPDSGLPVNPEAYAPGDQFIVRGTVTSMNLTPQTEPEFLVQAPSGQRYRMAAQSLDEVFFVDGSQLQAFEYRQGMIAQATVTLPATAGPSDILTTEDFTLIANVE